LSIFAASLPRVLHAIVIVVVTAPCALPPVDQEAKQPAKQPTSAPTEKNAAQIELLETKYRFETNGDSRKIVHARVRINNELGVRQFARLNFDFNRSFQSVEIPMVRVTHALGGTADILPSAITDDANSAVVDYPAYHDVRVKSVRILGLAPGDLLEYRVITTTTHHPLAPDFWLDHTFDRSGVVSQEIFELQLPAGVKTNLKTNPDTRFSPCSPEGQSAALTKCFLWNRYAAAKPAVAGQSEPTGQDISLSTFKSWNDLADKMEALIIPTKSETIALHDRTIAIAPRIEEGESSQLYEFVSQKIKTVDLPLDSTGFRRRKAMDILESGYGSAEDKFVLFAAMHFAADAGFVLDAGNTVKDVPSPAHFNYLLTSGFDTQARKWLDLNAEVAPEGMIPAQFRGKPVLVISPNVKEPWQEVTPAALYKSVQEVRVKTSLASDGVMSAKVRYSMRGENELTLRVAFHKTEKEKWKDVAQMLAVSDGFRGQIMNVTASDPYATKEPFAVEYEISQPKFVDWSKKTVRIPAILPLPGLPDPPTTAQLESKKPIDLGTPLAIELEATIELPAGATAQAPIGTTVNRDYATFSSRYSVQGNTLHASRSLHFLSSELPASRATDFNAFLHAVQSDQSQLFTVQPAPQK
jgi:Domain of Unknown Function with PDB structure (DUF3857)